ncbi:serine hydrolase domain-containing protein [Cellulomonas dongxiuzhuiae]|uniref:Beta-lactamase family protein n=1 Tax=Cellulomonas dongxiuzhuiae TaxID=2819979 RepID=A0ABX8GPL3_9CELL|nr:serine hydrolase domain-containing protein [Cellulomonas dongxiuzhuiae]MBO3095843.1 beta-lactamase family protein [Cellulomonas dongxiuzhuiae]QWC17149.1 beta-lactamase family protein [Cellulomonas dongxiuzhuiae]
MTHTSEARDLPRRAPEEVGVPSAALLALVDALDAHDETHSVMVVRRGAVVAEGWWAPYGPDLPHDLYSLSKTFTAIAVGLAREEGLLTFDDPVLSFFGDEAPDEPSPHLAAMRVRHLLTMRTGHHDDASSRTFAGDDLVRAFLSLPVEHEPGSWFVYNTAATYMLSAIVTRLTGQRLLDYLRPRLFEPLGITGATWEQCPRGVDMGGFGLALRTRDIAALGVLLAQDGVVDGVRVLPAGWVAEASADGGPSVPEQDGDGPPEWHQGYGYQLWRCRHGAFRGDGAFGQFCVVVPDQDLVVAMTSGDLDMQGVLDRVWDLLAHLSADALPSDPAAHGALVRRLAGLAHPAPAGSVGDGVGALAGRDLVLERPVGPVHGVRIDVGPDEDTLVVRTADGDVPLRAGHGDWAAQTVTLPSGHGGPPRDLLTLASADRPEAGAYRVTVRAVTTPFRWTATVRVASDGTATLAAEQNVGYGVTSSGEVPLRLQG